MPQMSGITVGGDGMAVSTSSAMPDSAPAVHLRARVHRHLSAEKLAQLDASSLHFRSLVSRDLTEMMDLHSEWFPVVYQESFFQQSTNGEILTIAATYSDAARPITGGSSCSGGGCDDAQEVDHILGMVTLGVNCEHHITDVMNVLGDSYVPFEDGTDAGSTHVKTNSLAYILTLGVVDEYRRRGLAREMLTRSVDHIIQHMPETLALYLHVIPYNVAAVQLYESMGFLRVASFDSFYHIHGQSYGSFLYALYLNGGRPPLAFRLWNMLGSTLGPGWGEWLLSRWNSFWTDKSDSSLKEGQSQEG